MCPSCGKTLSWYELFPLVSYVMLRGRCSKCKSAISPQYPIVEALTGVVFILLGFKFAPLIDIAHPFFLFAIIWYTYIWCLMIVIAVYDVRHTIIPNKLVWLANALAFLALYLFSNFHFAFHPATFSAVLAGPVLAIPFWALWFGSGGKWMGLGDAKLVLGLGWLLGMSSGVVALFLAFWLGAIFSVALLLIKGRSYSMKSQIPFGPFLVLSAFIVFISGIDFVTLSRFLTF